MADPKSSALVSSLTVAAENRITREGWILLLGDVPTVEKPSVQGSPLVMRAIRAAEIFMVMMLLMLVVAVL